MKLAFLIRLLFSKIFFFLDRLFFQYQKSFVVLCYHSFAKSKNRYAVDLRQFELQIKKITKFAKFISVEDMSLTEQKLYKKFNTNAKVLLTIDDGLESVMDILPITKKYNIPVLLFVLADSENANRSELETEENFLSWQQIKLLENNGWTIGCHSATHADFSILAESELKNEIVISKKMLESKIGHRVDHFAYPKGFYNDKIVNAAKKAGYKYGFTIEAGTFFDKKNDLEVPRTIIDSSHKINEVPEITTPLWLKFRNSTNRFKLWERFMK